MNIKMCEIMQEVEYLSEEQIKKGIESQSCITEWAYIKHDKDTDEKGELKRPHWHVMLKFTDSRNTKYIAKWFGVEEQYIEKCKTSWKNMIAYLTHANAKGKYSYDDCEVVTNFDIVKTRESPINDDRLSEILQGIDVEKIKEYNITEYVTLEEYTKYKMSIRSAFEFVNSRKGKDSDREMDVIFITGVSGTGKSTYAKQICKDKGYSYYLSSGGKNPLDDYKGQDAVILDDLRASDYKCNELLKMLDNNTASNVGCRYYNKSMCWCKLIIITSVVPQDEWYKNLQENEVEPIVQFKRRCKTKIEMRQDTISMSVFSEKKRDYVHVGDIPNVITAMYQKEEMTENEAIDFMINVLGSSANALKSAKKIQDFEEVKEDEEVPFDE